MKEEKTVRVLYLSELTDLGGGETSLLNLVCQLSRSRQVKPIVACPQEGELTRVLASEGIPVALIPMGNIERAWRRFGIPDISLSSYRPIAKLLQKNAVDLVHANTLRTLLIAAPVARFFSIPVIWTCHGWWMNVNRHRSWVIRLFADRIVAVSKMVRESLELPDKKVIVRPLGVDVKRYAQGDGRRIRSGLGLNSKELLIGMIARFQAIKGHKYFVRAASHIATLYKDIRFIIVGDTLFGNPVNEIYKRETIQLVSELRLQDRFIFTGIRSDVPDLLEAMDILVVPSESETFGMVVIEGMAAGCPIVATDCGGPSEIIQDGESGLLFKSQDVEDLSDKILYLVKSPEARAYLGENARRRAVQFSIDECARKMYDLYISLLN